MVRVGIALIGVVWNVDSYFSTSTPALRRLIRREFVSVELPSMLEFLAHEDVDAEIRSLPKEDAQTFVDVVDQVRYTPIHNRESTRRNQH